MKVKTSLIFMVVLTMAEPGKDFKADQLKYPRVREAYRQNWPGIRELLQQNQIDSGNLEIFLRIFKSSETIELWGKNKEASQYQWLKSYPFCSTSGSPGPKRKQGDYQIPEGFYFIDRFNPSSHFHLSLGINYPNRSDRILGDPEYPGGDIFIHGSCVTIGCIPITDDLIRELYVLAVEAKNAGQEQIPVHIFPCQLEGKELIELEANYAGNDQLIRFWRNLKEGYDYFRNSNTLPGISVKATGEYYLE